MKILDPANTLDGSGPTVEVLPIEHPPQPRPWWKWRTRKWTEERARFRLRVLDDAGRVVLDLDDYALYLILMYFRN